MQSFYPVRFEREMGCTEAEWLGWLPRALGVHAYELQAGQARVHIGTGVLALHWQALEPRVIALIRIPRLQVRFSFQGLDDAQRFAFMKRFDLYTQRGGG
jgi:hypothetical protein